MADNYDIYADVDIHNNQLLNAIAQVLGADIGTPSQGQFWFVDVDKTMRFFNGTAVIKIGTLDQISKAAADLDLNSHKVINVEDGTGPKDAVNKSQLDTVVAGIPDLTSVLAELPTLAHLTDIPDVSGFALASSIPDLAPLQSLIDSANAGLAATVAEVAAHEAKSLAVHGIPDTSTLVEQADLTPLSDANAATNVALANHEANFVGVHGIDDTGELVVLSKFDGLVASSLFGAKGYDPLETVPLGDQRLFDNAIWEARSIVPAGCEPLGSGDGSPEDQQRLVARASGFAHWVTGGQGKTVFTVTNDNDSGAGSLRQKIIDAKAAGGGWIIFDKTYNVLDGMPTYVIVPASSIDISGVGAHDITIDCRGADVTYTGAGAPGFAAASPWRLGGPIGTPPFTFFIGGKNWLAYIAGGNTTPASNIIIHGMKFPFNAGGEEQVDPGNPYADVFDILYWARGVWVDHCEFSNLDHHSDGNFEIGYGATDITQSWCIVGPHAKSEIVINTIPPEVGRNVPAGISRAAPGPYDIWQHPTDPGQDKVITKISYHHNYKPHVGDRCPFIKGESTWGHQWNNWVFEPGFWTPTGSGGEAEQPFAEPWPLFIENGHAANIGGGPRMGDKSWNVIENCIVTPYANAQLWAATHGIDISDGGPWSKLRSSGNLLEGAMINVHGDYLPETVFDPLDYYEYQLEVADATLKAKILAGAGKKEYWKYIGPAEIKATVKAQDDGVDVGTFSVLNVTGAALTFDPITKVLTLAGVPGADGVDGVDGAPGAPGVAGATGPQGAIGGNWQTLAPTGALAQTCSRINGSAAAGNQTSGIMQLVIIWLPTGLLVSSISFLSGSIVLATGLNQWFALFDATRHKLAVTVDDTSAAWAAYSPKTLVITGGFTTTYSGWYYLGEMVKATTVPSLSGITATPVTKDLQPRLAGQSTTNLTNPASCPAIADDCFAGGNHFPYAWVS